MVLAVVDLLLWILLLLLLQRPYLSPLMQLELRKNHHHHPLPLDPLLPPSHTLPLHHPLQALALALPDCRSDGKGTGSNLQACRRVPWRHQLHILRNNV